MKKTLIIFITLILNIQFKQIVPTCNKTAYDQFIKNINKGLPKDARDNLENYIQCNNNNRRKSEDNNKTDLSDEEQELLEEKVLETYYNFKNSTIKNLLKKIIKDPEDSNSIDKLITIIKKAPAETYSSDNHHLYQYIEYFSTNKVKEAFAKAHVESIAPGLTKYLLKYKEGHSLSIEESREVEDIFIKTCKTHHINRYPNIYNWFYSVQVLIPKYTFDSLVTTVTESNDQASHK